MIRISPLSTFLGLHLFFISWSGVLRFSAWTPLPVIFLFLSVIYLLFLATLVYFRNERFFERVSKVDFLLITALVTLLVTTLLNPNSKSLNYLMAYFCIFGSYFILLTFARIKINLQFLIKSNVIAVMLVAIFIVIETVGRSFFEINVWTVISRAKEATATVSPNIFRGYAFATEPIQTANYFCCFAPYAFAYVHEKRRKLFIVFASFVIISASLTFSVVMIIVFVSGVILIFVISRNKKIFLINSLKICFVLSVPIFTFVVFAPNHSLGILSTIVDKLTLREGVSASQRIEALQNGLNIISNHPFVGVGLGNASSLGQSSSINWYVSLASEAGIFAVVFFSLWFSYYLYRAGFCAKYKKNTMGLAAVFSIYSGMAFLFFTSTFFNCFLLTSVLLFRLMNRQKVIFGETKTC